MTGNAVAMCSEASSSDHVLLLKLTNINAKNVRAMNESARRNVKDDVEQRV